MNIEEDIGPGERLVSPAPKTRESVNENSLRPKRLDEYIGQEQVRHSLGIFMEAAKGRREPLDHVLFHGFPGLGKTTLSYIIANEMQQSVKFLTELVSLTIFVCLCQSFICLIFLLFISSLLSKICLSFLPHSLT